MESPFDASDLAALSVRRALTSTPMVQFDGIKGGKYYLVQTLPQFLKVMEEAVQQSTISVDTETSGLDWVRDHVAGVVLGWGGEHNYYIPVAHRCSQECCLGGRTHEKQLSWDVVLKPLQDLLANPELTTVWWHAKFDLHMLRKEDIEVHGVIHDGVILAHLLDENGSHELKEMSVDLLDKQASKWEIVIDEWREKEARRRRTEFSKLLKEASAAALKANTGVRTLMSKEEKAAALAQSKNDATQSLRAHIYAENTKKEVSYDFIPLFTMAPYACADTHYTWLLWKRFLIQVAGHADLKKLYVNEMQLTRVLLDVEHTGVKIDRDYLLATGPKLQDEIDKHAEEIFADVGFRFNIGSDDQLIDALQKSGVKLTKLTKGAQKKQKEGVTDGLQFSVDKEVLEFLATKYPFAYKVQKHRQIQKIKGTYVDSILELMDSDHFLHTSFNQNVSTGRMSSKEPNVQNIPARDKTIRRAFMVPDDEYFFVFIDYSQVELRLTAHHSQDQVLLACYPWEGKGKDVHSITCSEVVMGVTLEELAKMKNDDTGHDKLAAACECPKCITDFMRSIAKRVNFGIIYGAGAGAIQRQVSKPSRQVTKEQCQEYIDKYFQKYRGVREWILSVQHFMQRHGYVQNTFGRYRRLPNVKSAKKWERERAERQGGNFLIQGDAADLFKEAAVRVRKVFREHDAKSKLVNFVHDELQFYWHKSELHLLKPVKKVMEDFPQFSVPIVAEVSYSTDYWSGKKELKLAA